MNLTESFFDTGEVNLHYIEGPRSGPPLVFLHGATGDWTTWQHLLPELTPRWHVFAIELRGHGKSGWAKDRTGYQIEHNVADTLAFLRARVESPAVLVGHSWGGVISLLSAGPGKEYLSRLVLVDPPLLLRRPNTEIKPFLDYFAWVLHLKQSTHTVDELGAAILADNPGGIPPEILNPMAQRLFVLDANFLLALLNGSEAVDGVDFAQAIQAAACPILLLQADPAKNCALLDEDIAFVQHHTTNAQVVCFPGAGHGIHEEQPAEFLQAMNTFLSP